jgi:hypothetical protein
MPTGRRAINPPIAAINPSNPTVAAACIVCIRAAGNRSVSTPVVSNSNPTTAGINAV